MGEPPARYVHDRKRAFQYVAKRRCVGEGRCSQTKWAWSKLQAQVQCVKYEPALASSACEHAEEGLNVRIGAHVSIRVEVR